MNSLLKAIPPTMRLIMVGDIDQLPSVGPGAVLKDLIQSETIETVVLNQIFRQAAKSKIIVNAHRVNEGGTLLEAKESTIKIEDEVTQDDEVELLNEEQLKIFFESLNNINFYSEIYDDLKKIKKDNKK